MDVGALTHLLILTQKTLYSLSISSVLQEDVKVNNIFLYLLQECYCTLIIIANSLPDEQIALRVNDKGLL